MKEEKIIYNVRPHLIVLFPALPVLLVTLVAAVIIKAPLAFILAGLAGGGTFLYLAGRRYAARLVITDERVYARRGLFLVRSILNAREEIVDAEAIPSVFGGAADCEHIKISTAEGVFWMRFMPCAKELCRELHGEAHGVDTERMSSRGSRAMPESRVSGQPEKMPVQSMKSTEAQQPYRTGVASVHDTRVGSRENSGLLRKRSEVPLWVKDSPILITEYRILEQEESGELFLSLDVQNLTHRTIAALYMEIYGYNVLKEEKEHITEAVWLDLEIKSGGVFTLKDQAFHDITIRNVKLIPRHVVYADEEIWNYEKEEGYSGVTLKKEIYEEELKKTAQRIGMEKTAHHYSDGRYLYYPEKTPEYWMCACGQINTGTVCISCGEDEDNILSVFSAENLRKEDECERERRRYEKEEEERQERERQEKLAEEAGLRAKKEAEERAAREAARKKQVEQIRNTAEGFFTKVGEKVTEAGSRIVESGSELAKRQQDKAEEKKAIREENSRQQAVLKMQSPEAASEEDAEICFCGKCGSRIVPGDMFCGECGEKIG
ncbi:MAG: zinc ribbon domain-containing protein [Lachnospiraceae bacterium]|nr:zinc ribbon domain-containing protein [Lachnospiraceae bacterium]